MFNFFKKLFGNASVERVEPVIVPEVQDELVTEVSGNLTIKAMAYDDDTGQIRIDMDWDQEFVDYLKRNGFTGVSEEAIVQKYVATLYQNMLSRQQQDGTEYE